MDDNNNNEILEDSNPGVEQQNNTEQQEAATGSDHVAEMINPLREQDPPEPSRGSGGNFDLLIAQMQAQMAEQQRQMQESQEQLMKTIMDLKEETEKNARIERERQAAAAREAETQRILAIEQARQQAEADAEKLRASERERDVTITVQPAPVIDLQLADISSPPPTDDFSSLFSPVLLDDKNSFAAAAVQADTTDELAAADIATTESLITSEQALAHSSIILSPVIFSNDNICVIQQCYDKEALTLSFAHTHHAEQHESGGAILQPCHEATTTVDLLNAEHFAVVSASRVWDPGGPASCYCVPRRDDERANDRRGEIDTSLSGFFLPCQQAWERWEQQGRGTTHSDELAMCVRSVFCFE